MSVMGLRENPKCPLCDEEDETSLHLVGELIDWVGFNVRLNTLQVILGTVF